MTRLALISAVLCAVAAPALAHHSFAMFDRTREVTITGTVKEWQFSNPHAYLQVLAPHGAQGETKEWSLETAGISTMLRRGYARDTFSRGDKVSVTLHPLRNESAGGELVSVTGADGVVRKFF